MVQAIIYLRKYKSQIFLKVSENKPKKNIILGQNNYI